ncbi:helix-turn-helix transcriptional regulator [Streptomyces sp. FXJ1.172]|uniref:helix-turn-helix domain-containing protein n=1 Tax=Streptomyces sp. FXJ1.172 TaxID=710705 RepID=UPI0007CF5086|nr:helix-turn-helix transcriptional regulator [Streptomyces sp. FXJ1.172]WEO92812.1 helix-turn-helix transcriptional regulator [Streptomyces sp. FXJ1.172]
MSETEYGFDPAKLRAARDAAGASVAQIARAAGVSERAVNLYLAGSRTPRPETLVQLAAAVGVAPADLCSVEHELLAHLRVFTGRSRAAMAQALGMAEETYRQPETTGHRGRLSSSRYDHAQDRWIAWQEWAPPLFGVTAERLLAAEQHTREHYSAEREERWRQLRERDPDRVAMIEELGRRLREQ